MANRILREWDYDNDLNYENVYDSALDYITKYKPGVQSWREIASAIGYRMNTIGPNDMELLKDAIEDAMMESSRPVGSGNPNATSNPMSDISMNSNQNESRIMNKKLIRLTEGDLHRIVKESVRRIIKEDVALPVKEAYENMIQAMENFETSVVENMNVQNDDGRYQSLDDALTKAKYAAESIVNGGFKHPHPNAFR